MGPLRILISEPVHVLLIFPFVLSLSKHERAWAERNPYSFESARRKPTLHVRTCECPPSASRQFMSEFLKSFPTKSKLLTKCFIDLPALIY